MVTSQRTAIWPEVDDLSNYSTLTLTHMYLKSWQPTSCVGSKMTKWLKSATRWSGSLDCESLAYEKRADGWQ